MVSKDKGLDNGSKRLNHSVERPIDDYVKNLVAPLNGYAAKFCEERGVEFKPTKIMSYDEGKKIYKDLEFGYNTVAKYNYRINTIFYSPKLEHYLKSNKNFIDSTITHELGHSIHYQLFGYRYPNKQVKSVTIRNFHNSELLKINYTGEGIANLIGAYLFLNLKGVNKPSNGQLINTLIDKNLNKSYSDNASDIKDYFKGIKGYTKKFRPNAFNPSYYDKGNSNQNRAINEKSKFMKFEDLRFSYLLDMKNDTDDVSSEIKSLFYIKFNYLYSNFDIIKLLEKGKSIDRIIEKKSKKLNGKYYKAGLKFINSRKYNNFLKYGTAASGNISDLNKLIEFVNEDPNNMKKKSLKEVRKELKRKLRFKRKRKIEKRLDLNKPFKDVIKNSKKPKDFKRFIRYGLKVDKYLNRIEKEEKKISGNEDKN